MTPAHHIPAAPDKDAIICVGRDGTIHAVNHKAETITGLTAPELMGRPVKKIFRTHEGGAGFADLYDSVQEGKIISNHPVRLCDDTGGDAGSILADIIPLPDVKGVDGGALVCFGKDSFSPRAEHILQSLGDGVFTVDRQWKITSFNRAAEKITGWSTGQAIGRSCSKVFQASSCGKNCAIAECLYSGRAVSNRSITITNTEGLKIPVSISAAPLADHEGNIIGGVQTFRDLSVLDSMRKQLRRKHRFDEIVSKSRAMQRLFTILPEVARSPSTVLVSGESGTGKELVATALYNISSRQDNPFVVLNCGALPENLLESELFGYKAGAFTDARKDKPGRFAAAEGGTLFLDEIGDIPTSIQVKLLRVLQEKIYEPLGSNTPVKTDVRIITATNQDLKALVREGRFREDLYYRLNVVRIHLPPLRERKEDIPLLSEQFISEFNVQLGKDIAGISNPALNVLMNHDFPGNIRELKNIIEYAFILCEGGYILQEHLPEPFNTGNGLTRKKNGAEQQEPNRRMTLEEIEKQAVFLALENNHWKKVDTCRELRISKDTLRRKMIKYDLQRPMDDELNR
jgi:PAS domain S-box-containing protein